MALQIVGDVGPQALSDGVSAPFRLGRGGEVVVQQMHGRLYETTKRGNVYEAVTAVSGVAPGTTISTTMAYVLVNPSGSGVDLVILKALLGYISGTLGAGTVFHCAAANQTLPQGTAIVPVNTKTQQATGSKAVPLTTATVAAAPLAVRPAFNLGAALATTALGASVVKDDVDGEFVISPGSFMALHAVAGGGSSPLVVLGYAWEEVPI